MRTPLSSGLAAASLVLLVAGLALRRWQVGLAAEVAARPSDGRLVVAPTMEDLRRTKLQPRRTRPWFGQVPSRQIGAGTEFWGVREYAAGDEVRRINWKASARLDRLFTNEYEGERSGDVVIVVDARRESFVGTETDNPIEHGVRAALGIAEHVLASKNRVGLIVQREVIDWVPPAFGRKQLYRILDHLTQVRPGGEWPFAYIAWVLSRFFPRDCLIVVVSPLEDRTALNAVIDLEARGYDVAIVSPSPLAIEWRLGQQRPEDKTAYPILRIERDNRGRRRLRGRTRVRAGGPTHAGLGLSLGSHLSGRAPNFGGAILPSLQSGASSGRENSNPWRPRPCDPSADGCRRSLCCRPGARRRPRGGGHRTRDDDPDRHSPRRGLGGRGRAPRAVAFSEPEARVNRAHSSATGMASAGFGRIPSLC